MCSILEEMTASCDDAISLGQFDQLSALLDSYSEHTRACDACRAQALFYRAVWIAIAQNDAERAYVLLNALIDTPQTDIRLRARALGFQAMLLDQMDRYSDALHKHQESARLCDAAGDNHGFARALYNQAIILTNRLANTEHALRLLDQAEAALQGVHNPIVLARILNERGLARLRQHNWEQARTAFQRAFDYCAEQGHTEYLAVCEVNFGNIDREQGLLDSAARWYSSALARDTIDWESRAEALLHRSALAQQQGHNTAAHEDLAALMQLARDQPSYYFLALALLALARLAAAEADDWRALSLYWSAVDAVEQIQSAQDISTVRLDFQTHWQQLYPEAVSCALRLGQTDQALLLSERGRSRLLLDTIGWQPGEDNHSAPLEWVIEQDRLRQELRDSYLRSLTASSDISNEPESEAIEQRIATLRENMSHYARETFPAELPPSLEQLQRAIPANALVISYVQHTGGLVVFGVDQRLVRSCDLPVVMQDITNRLNERGQLHDLLPDPGARLWRHMHLLHMLHNVLIAPIENWMEGYTTIYIVPELRLRHIPFHLLTPHSGQTSRLTEDGRLVRYLPSVSMLTRIAPLSIDGPLLAVGTNLPNLALVESHITGVALRHAGQALCAGAATRLAISRAAGGANQIYFVGHNRFSTKVPHDTGLLLGDTKLLTLADIRRLPLKGKRVLIGACQSSLVAERGGDWIGLTSALLQAGASQVIGTLWDVSEVAICVLMDRFWKLLTPGTDPLTALSQAQDYMRGLTAAEIAASFAQYGLTTDQCTYLDGQLQALEAALPGQEHPFDHPFYWGAFVVVGI